MEMRAWVRGSLSLGVLAALTAALLASPVGAGGTLTKKKVKKIATGVVKANGGIFIVSKEGPTDTPDSLGTIASLSLPAGTYAVFAKGVFQRGTAAEGNVLCELHIGGSKADEARMVLRIGSETDIMTLQGAGGGGTTEFRCRDDTVVSTSLDVKITALRTPSLTATTA